MLLIVDEQYCVFSSVELKIMYMLINTSASTSILLVMDPLFVVQFDTKHEQI